ncbi:MAG: hypothetical protein E7160_00735 [Firmicutes bacterium]|nr:hypothetical protein [Bacillota bacterium]
MNSKNKKILITILIITTIIIVIVGYTLYIIKELGLDHINKYDNYNNMIEIKLDTGIDFAFILDKDNNIIQPLYLSKKTTILNLNKLESKNINTSINKVIKELVIKNKIKNKLYIIEYNNQNLSSVLEKQITEELIKNNIKTQIVKQTSTLQKRVKKLEINREDTKGILITLSLYSKNIANINNNDNPDEEIELTKENALEYSNTIYDKIRKYQISNNITDEDINNHKINIQQIPISSNNDLYPDQDSWYYIKDRKVYAYIKFSIGNISYSYCYNGTKENINEGECIR